MNDLRRAEMFDEASRLISARWGLGNFAMTAPDFVWDARMSYWYASECLRTAYRVSTVCQVAS